MSFNYKNLLILQGKTLMEAMKQLNEVEKKILFVVDNEERLIGSITDGDIRRYILRSGRLNAKVEDICNKNPLFIIRGQSRKQILQRAEEENIKYVPVVNEDKKIVEILIIEEVPTRVKLASFQKLNIPAVIMAGGLGKRLDPFTRVLPKPLIPIGNKTILEIIMENLYMFGIDEFWISVNYKAKIIKAYLEELNLPYRINYIHEDKPLGTAGSLYMLKDKLKSDDFILSNADILINIDYLDLWNMHKAQDNHITMVVSAYTLKVPYGVCKIENGQVVSLKEKPEYNFLVNVGMYLIKTELLGLVPDEEFFNATELIDKAMLLGKRVGAYPVHEDNWIDVGQWEEYKKAVERMKV